MNCRNSLIYPVDRGSADFDQQCGGILAQFAHDGRQPGLVFDRAQGRAVEQLDSRHGLRLEADDRFAGGANVREEHERAGLERVLDHGVVGDARNEAERAFRADHQMRQDVDRVFIIDQGVQAVTGGVLDLELVADAFGQLAIGACVAPRRSSSPSRTAWLLLKASTLSGSSVSSRLPSASMTRRPASVR
jgi:hypothetical protein